jgi:DNA-binding NtrC family response regulator
MPKLDGILDEIEELELDDQEVLLDVLKNRVVEHRRHKIAIRAQEAFYNASSGKSTTGSFEQLWADLND